MTEQLVRVEICGLPLPLLERAREHHADLTREMVLVAEALRQRGDAGALPVRFVTMVREMTHRYAMVTAEQQEQINAAVNRGETIVDLHFEVPAAAIAAAAHLSELLDEADDYCRRGHLLLTLETPADLTAYRHWFLGEFGCQAAGRPSVSWADYRPAADGQVS